MTDNEQPTAPEPVAWGVSDKYGKLFLAYPPGFHSEGRRVKPYYDDGRSFPSYRNLSNA